MDDDPYSPPQVSPSIYSERNVFDGNVSSFWIAKCDPIPGGAEPTERRTELTAPGGRGEASGMGTTVRWLLEGVVAITKSNSSMDGEI